MVRAKEIKLSPTDLEGNKICALSSTEFEAACSIFSRRSTIVFSHTMTSVLVYSQDRSLMTVAKS